MDKTIRGAARPPQLHALTGVRFLAALHVVIFHDGRDALLTSPWPIQAIAACGPTAVSLFYVLSGTVLAYSSTATSGALAMDRRSFWYARFARIYPAYLLALILDAPFFASKLLKTYGLLAALPWSVALGVPVVLLLHAWTPMTVFAWNIPGWSLSTEAFFYAAFPSLATRLRCTSLAALVRRTSALYAVALIPVILLAIADGFQDALPQLPLPAGTGQVRLSIWLFNLFPLSRLPEFLMGICLGYWLRARQAVQSRPPAPVTAALLEAVTVGALIGAFLWLGSQARVDSLVGGGIIAPLFAVLIAALAIGDGPLAKVLSTRPLIVLGEASYALYILQEPVLIWTARIPFFRSLSGLTALAAFVATLTVVSVLAQRLIAEPARLWLLALRRRRVLN